MPDCLWPHRLQHSRLPCPPLSPGVCSNSWALSRWYYLTISATLFSCPQPFPAPGSLLVSLLFPSGGQNIGISASASVVLMNQFSSVQSLSRVWLFVTPWTAAHKASLSITNSHSLLKLMSIESVMPSNHLILCWPLLLLPSIFSSIRAFSNESVLRIMWLKYWSFSFNISPSDEHPGLISFRMDWLDLLAVQGTLKSLLQHCTSKASILWSSAFFMVQLSHPYVIMTMTGKTLALPRRTFVGKVMSLLFNMLSRLVVAFLPRSKRFLISRLQSNQYSWFISCRIQLFDLRAVQNILKSLPHQQNFESISSSALSLL